jgi:hypothetical protein
MEGWKNGRFGPILPSVKSFLGKFETCLYYDDILLYEGTIKPLAVEPTLKLATTWGRVKKSK